MLFHARTTTAPPLRAVGATTLVLALAFGLSACGDTAQPAADREISTTEHNDADVEFASTMIQHHAQALSMVDLTIERTRLDPEVQQLAEDIRAAQGPEIETMADWLTSWGEEVPETMRDHVNAGHDMDDMGMNGSDGSDAGTADMPGMMTAEDMAALEDAADADFQDLWLKMMVEHHEGAVEMAKAERDSGQYKDAVDLAGAIIDGQSEEIETMKGLLG